MPTPTTRQQTRTGGRVLESVPFHVLTAFFYAAADAPIVFTTVVGGSDAPAFDLAYACFLFLVALAHGSHPRDVDVGVPDADTVGVISQVRRISVNRTSTPWHAMPLPTCTPPLNRALLYPGMAEEHRTHGLLGGLAPLRRGATPVPDIVVTHTSATTQTADLGSNVVETDKAVPTSAKAYGGSAVGMTDRTQKHAAGTGTNRLDGALTGPPGREREGTVFRCFALVDAVDLLPVLLAQSDGPAEPGSGPRTISWAWANLVLRTAEHCMLYEACARSRSLTNGDLYYTTGHGVYSHDDCAKGGECGWERGGSHATRHPACPRFSPQV